MAKVVKLVRGEGQFRLLRNRLIHEAHVRVFTVMPDNPNPQGKASLPLLNELQGWRSVELPARNVRALLSDYLRGLLVLSADFRFRPAPGQDCYLYYRKGHWSLSLIAPDEWRPHRRASYVARCELRQDATWDLQPAPDLAERDEVVAALGAVVRGFKQRLNSSPTVADGLPHFEAGLPYYRRVLASGLARSLQGSLQQLGLEAADGRQLLQDLPVPARKLRGPLETTVEENLL